MRRTLFLFVYLLTCAQSVAAHRLPVFSGITLCISGIPDIVRRTQINKAITLAGGTYVKNLERPVRVTHLLCAGESETEKMRYAEKFNRAGEADPPIQLVWEEWFWDSLEYGGTHSCLYIDSRVILNIDT